MQASCCHAKSQPAVHAFCLLRMKCSVASIHLTVRLSADIRSKLPRSGLAALSCTYKSLKTLADPDLYENLVLKIPGNNFMSLFMDGLMTTNASGFQFVKRLRIKTLWANYRIVLPMNYRDPRISPYPVTRPTPDQHSGEGREEESRRVWMHLLDSIFRIVMDRIHKHRLLSIVWYHKLPMAWNSLRQAVEEHTTTLTELRVSSIPNSRNEQVLLPKSYPTKLQKLEIQSVGWQDIFTQ